MDDTDISAVSDAAQSKAGATFDAQIKSGASIETAATTAVTVGATVGATAACAATGVGAAVAPLCGAIGGWLAPKIVSVVKSIGKFFSDLFGPSEAYKKHVHDIRINEQDVKPDPNHVGTLYSQLRTIDYLLMQQLSDVVTTIGRGVQDFDMVPDGDKILDWLSKNVQLVFLSNIAHTASSGWIWVGPIAVQDASGAWDTTKYPEWKWDGNWRAPVFEDKATAILQQWGSGAITNKAAADAVKQLIADSQTWSQNLATQAAKYLVLLATDITVREGLTTSAGRYAPHVPEPDPKALAAVKRHMAELAAERAEGLAAPREFRNSYLTQFGIVDSIQFLRRGA